MSVSLLDWLRVHHEERHRAREAQQLAQARRWQIETAHRLAEADARLRAIEAQVDVLSRSDELVGDSSVPYDSHRGNTEPWPS